MPYSGTMPNHDLLPGSKLGHIFMRSGIDIPHTSCHVVSFMHLGCASHTLLEVINELTYLHKIWYGRSPHNATEQLCL